MWKYGLVLTGCTLAARELGGVHRIVTNTLTVIPDQLIDWEIPPDRGTDPYLRFSGSKMGFTRFPYWEIVEPDMH